MQRTPAGAWVDHQGRPVDVPEPPAAGSHYARIGAWQGAAYDRNAFTAGTEQETAALADVLGLSGGERLLDVGCGTGRHVRALRARGVEAVGIDLSPELVAGGGTGACCAARAEALPLANGSVDVVTSLCQGGFGLSPGADERAVAEMARVLRPGGRFAVTAFSLAFAVRYAGPGDALDLSRGLHHHTAAVRGPDGHDLLVDLWTTCYTPAHLTALLACHGLRVEAVTGAAPGAFGTHQPTWDDPELLAWGINRGAQV